MCDLCVHYLIAEVLQNLSRGGPRIKSCQECKEWEPKLGRSQPGVYTNISIFKFYMKVGYISKPKYALGTVWGQLLIYSKFKLNTILSFIPPNKILTLFLGR